MAQTIRFFGSTTLRLAALVVVLQLVATGSVLLYARYAINSQFTRDQQEVVGELERDLVDWHRGGGDAAVAAEIERRLAGTKGANVVLLLTGRDGRRIAGNLATWPTVLPRTTDWRVIQLYRMGSDVSERLGVQATALPGGAHLLTGRVVETGLRLAGISERVIVAAFALAVPLALVVAAIMSQSIDRRVVGIADTAAAVGDGDLARRVPRDGSGDSFDVLAAKINAMLARVQTLVEELRIVTGGLAHDLRTPILRLTATIEQAASEVRDPVALAAIDRVAQEAGILMAMLSTALQISQVEAGIGRNRFVDVDVGGMLADLAELYEPALDAQDIALTLAAPPIPARLHRELVSQAVGNLIDNAMKYAGATRLDLAVKATGTGVEISVSDNGIGVAVDDRATALRRFGRLDPSRTIGGAGLGLALVEAVARLHDGSLDLEDNRPGLRVVMRLAC